jgi:hypothetical protein
LADRIAQAAAKSEAEAEAQAAQAEADQLQIQALKARDQEVRRHEQAHAAAGGVYAGSPSYEYTTGPDGARYATGGEVSIDTAPVPGDPQATLEKAQAVRRAALAPAEPSEQDRRVAAEASQMAAQARVELLQLKRSDDSEETEATGQEVESSASAQEDDGAERARAQEAAQNEEPTQQAPSLLYSAEEQDADQEAESEEPEVSARDRFDQVYGSIASVTEQIGTIANYEASQPILERLFDDIA